MYTPKYGHFNRENDHQNSGVSHFQTNKRPLLAGFEWGPFKSYNVVNTKIDHPQHHRKRLVSRYHRSQMIGSFLGFPHQLGSKTSSTDWILKVLAPDQGRFSLVGKHPQNWVWVKKRGPKNGSYSQQKDEKGPKSADPALEKRTHAYSRPTSTVKLPIIAIASSDCRNVYIYIYIYIVIYTYI